MYKITIQCTINTHSSIGHYSLPQGSDIFFTPFISIISTHSLNLYLSFSLSTPPPPPSSQMRGWAT